MTQIENVLTALLYIAYVPAPTSYHLMSKLTRPTIQRAPLGE
jgi:hypothetical protein